MTTVEEKALSHLKYMISLCLESEELEQDYQVLQKAIMELNERRANDKRKPIRK